jgi:hypothetical protein
VKSYFAEYISGLKGNTYPSKGIPFALSGELFECFAGEKEIEVFQKFTGICKHWKTIHTKVFNEKQKLVSKLK